MAITMSASTTQLNFFKEENMVEEVSPLAVIDSASRDNCGGARVFPPVGGPPNTNTTPEEASKQA